MRYLFIERNAVTSTPTVTTVNNLNESTDASKKRKKMANSRSIHPRKLVLSRQRAPNYVNGPCLLDYLILMLRLPVVLYVSFAVNS